MVVDKVKRVTLNPTLSQGSAQVAFKSIFIAHAWRYGPDYDRLVKMLNQGIGLNQWQNLSAEQYCPASQAGGRAAALADLISRAHVVIVLSGLYPHFPDEIQNEITIAAGFDIPIISVVPSDQQSSPQSIRNIMIEEVPWACNRICDSVKKWS